MAYGCSVVIFTVENKKHAFVKYEQFILEFETPLSAVAY
jgi:hypothetical protein